MVSSQPVRYSCLERRMCEKNNNLLNFADVIQQLPGLFAIMGLDSRIICPNDQIIKACGFQSESQFIGTTAHQMHCPAVESAGTFISQNRQVMTSGVSMSVLDIHTYAHKAMQLLTKKRPYMKNGKIVGIICHSMEIQSQTFSQLCATLIISDKYYQEKKKGNDRSYLIGTTLGEELLSKREKDCVFYLLRGKTAKEISKYMNISFRTVETHIQNIKNKLGCESRSDIIEYALLQGYLNYIPQNFINADISHVLDVVDPL